MSIVIENCSFVYPSSGIGVHDVNISAGDGELVAVIGSSGSGKTTMLKLVAGFEQADSGRILINGRDVCGVPARLRNVGMVFQSYALFPLMTCAENVAYPLKIRKVPAAERRRKALDMLERVGLAVRSGEQGRQRPKDQVGLVVGHGGDQGQAARSAPPARPRPGSAG